MSFVVASKRRKGGPRNHPAPLDMTLLGVSGPPNPRGTILVSAARPSVKESVAALGLNYSLSSGGIPKLSAIPKVTPAPPPSLETQGMPSSIFSPDFVLDISSCSSHYTTTGASPIFSAASLSTAPPDLARLRTLSLPLSPVHQASVNAETRKSPHPPDPSTPVTPPLLTPAPMRPTRRWGMTVFPQNRVIRRASSAPPSPISFHNSPVSPTSIIAIKSPVELRDSRRVSDAFSLASSFTTSLPRETDVFPVASALPLIGPQSPGPLSPTSAPGNPVTSAGTEITRSMAEMALGKKNKLDAIKESDSPAEAERKQPRSPKTKANPKHSFRRVSYHRRIPSTHRREGAVLRPHRRPLLKRDSGAPFATATEAATEASSPLAQVEWGETKGGRRNTRRWSASRKLLQTSTKRAKATVVMMRRGKEQAEEKDIIAVIPQLRELKAPKKLRL